MVSRCFHLIKCVRWYFRTVRNSFYEQKQHLTKRTWWNSQIELDENGHSGPQNGNVQNLFRTSYANCDILVAETPQTMTLTQRHFNAPYAKQRRCSPLQDRDYVYVRLDPKVEGLCRGNEAQDKATIRTHVKAARSDGFTVHSRYAVSERVGASVAASGRPKLMALIRQLKPGDALVVYTLDGMGRDAADVLNTIRLIHEKEAEPFCASLGRDENLYNDAEFIDIMNAVAALEGIVDKERTQARANGLGAAGGRIGRPPSLDEETQTKVRASLEAGETIATVARRYNTSRQTIMRVRDATAKP